ncbi:hypothetical protein [Ekhidna sp.]|uniref:hypothetical protein n=1 Tax=Ekhidna sp. TaxID=2608089 RepID=UPI00329748A0
MKYLIVTNSPESNNYAKLLAAELRRYDIRAEIFTNVNGRVEQSNENFEFPVKSKPIKSKHLKNSGFDLLIVIGETFDKRLVQKVTSRGAFTCFFQLTLNYKDANSIYQSALTLFDKVFVDLPIHNPEANSNQIGHFLNDIIRKHHFSENYSDQLRIGALLSDEKNIGKLKKIIREFQKKSKECQWIVYVNMPTEISKSRFRSLENVKVVDSELNLLKYANAVIVDSELDSIAAAFLNCPQISISGKYGIFGFTKTKKPLINECLKTDIIKNLIPNEHELIVGELSSLLNDHEHCASMMASYQKFKDKVGTQPVARTAAQMITEWLEEMES